MLKRVEHCIIWPHEATLRCDQIIGLLMTIKPNSQYNISLIKDRWVEYLAVVEITKS